MSDEIKADYQQLEQIASKFASQAQTVEQTLQKVRNSMGKLENGGWIGQAASKFFGEMNSQVLPSSQRLHQALGEAGRAVKEVSNTIKQAEEEAGSPFRM